MAYEHIAVSVSDYVAHIRLNRPEAMNSITLELARDLMHAALDCDENPEVRAVVLSGSGKMFCSGGDLKTFSTKGADLPRYLKETTTYLHAAVSRLTRTDSPVIVAVQGAAAGAGMSLACAADLVIAEKSSKFTMAYTRAGLTPDGSSTYFLSRIVGLRRALELTLTNRVLTAEEAALYGIVTRVVDDGWAVAEAETLAAELAQGATRALGASKRLLHEGWSGTLETQMELETRAIADMAKTRDGREGIASFAAKRIPTFEGR